MSRKTLFLREPSESLRRGLEHRSTPGFEYVKNWERNMIRLQLLFTTPVPWDTLNSLYSFCWPANAGAPKFTQGYNNSSNNNNTNSNSSGGGGNSGNGAAKIRRRCAFGDAGPRGSAEGGRARAELRVRSSSELVVHCAGKARGRSLSGNSRHAPSMRGCSPTRGLRTRIARRVSAAGRPAGSGRNDGAAAKASAR